MNFSKTFFNLILPPRCICCGKVLGEENGLCPDCFNKITFITAPYCKCCGMPFTDITVSAGEMLCPRCLQNKMSHLRMCRSAVKYDENSKLSIMAFKFMDRTENAEIFAKWLKIAGKDIFDNSVDLIIPVPLHYMRLIKRRYNQSALLAERLSEITGVKVDTCSLIKHKSTKPQVSFCGSQRIDNVKGVFSVKYPERIAKRHVVLIDDVYTTGSTIKECALALHKAGAASVDALTVARVC